VEYTHLGRSGLSVSRLVLGAMNFGPLDELFPPPGANGAKSAPEAYAW
jgi:aryl-alcohol dehydrogenase-like predicted oxidoreductase